MVQTPGKSAAMMVRSRIGLIIGPGATIGADFFERLTTHLSKQFKVEGASDYRQVCDAALAGRDSAEVRAAIRTFVEQQPTLPTSQFLSKNLWASVLSGCLDSSFEKALEAEANSRPASQPVAVIDQLGLALPPDKPFSFKLLGSHHRDDFVASSADYALRKASWRRVVRSFSDVLKGAPMLCVGLAECPWLLLDLITEMLAEPTCTPTAVLVLETDPLVQSPVFVQIQKSGFPFEVIKGTVGELTRAAYEAAMNRRQRVTAAAGDDHDAIIGRFHEIMLRVNPASEPQLKRGEKVQLRAVLFSPSIPNWDPCAYDLDFRRSSEKDIIREINTFLTSKQHPNGVVAIVGAAATGKSVLLKRVAWELAKAGEVVVWFRTYLGGNVAQLHRDFFKTLSLMKAQKRKKLIIVLDDPFSSPSLHPGRIYRAAQVVGVEVVFLVAARKSDWEILDQGDFSGGLPVSEERLPDLLDDDEWKRLPSYLLSLDIVKDVKEADILVGEAKTHDAQDTLAALYFLLPESRSAITDAVRDEYFRLGDHAALSKIVLASNDQSAEIIQKAYRLVAASDRAGVPVPVEVLVSTLRVSYQEWLNAHPATDRDHYGLLYNQSVDEDDNGYYYRTRNSVVTNVLVGMINGGGLSRAGEVRELVKLLAACTGSQAIYRNFCVSILVPWNRLEKLDYADGLRLYDSAMQALPFPDKTLVHHRGLWIKNKGDRPLEAIKVLEDALTVPNYPYAERLEADEHIHTSLAATMLDAMDRQEIDPNKGKTQVIRHLQAARRTGFFSANAVHVQARHVARLLRDYDSTLTDRTSMLSDALADLDRSLILVRTTGRHDDEQALQEARTHLVVDFLANTTTLEADAEKVFQDFAAQDGFALLVRQYTHVALEKNKGTAYKEAFDKTLAILARLDAAKVPPAVSLAEAAVHLYLHWRVLRESDDAKEINWAWLEQFSGIALSQGRLKSDPLLRFCRGVARAQLAKWDEAHMDFSELRRMTLPKAILWTVRTHLKDERGSRQRVQGTVTRTGDKTFVACDALGTSIIGDNRSAWPEDKQIVHVYVGFSFGGAQATLITP